MDIDFLSPIPSPLHLVVLIVTDKLSSSLLIRTRLRPWCVRLGIGVLGFTYILQM